MAIIAFFGCNNVIAGVTVDADGDGDVVAVLLRA